MQGLWQDVRYSVRMLVKNPGYTALALILLAIGIGVNATVYSVLDFLFLRSLPVQEPKQIIRINARREGQGKAFSYPDYQDIRSQSKSFVGIIAYSRKIAELEQKGEREMIPAEWVSDNYFPVLGIKPAIGQGFQSAEEWNAGEDPPVIISHGLWQRRFGSDPAIAGKTIIINRRSVVVRGVAPSTFPGLGRPMTTEIWLPFHAWGANFIQKRDNADIDELLGRLQSTAELDQARAELDTIASRLALAYPATNQGVSYIATRLEKKLLESLMITAVFLSGPFLILLICCANVSGITLAKAEGRRTEIAVRAALGSGRRRILRQLLTESLLLALPGAGFGLLLTSWLISLQSALMPPMPIEISFDIRVDSSVLIFSLCVSIAAALLSGLAPALQAVKENVYKFLKGTQGRTEDRRYRFGLRNILVAGQVALSLTLLIATGLFLKSLILSEQINPGFDAKKKLLIVTVAPLMNPQESSQKFFLPVIEQIKSLPGVKGATYALRLLLSGSGGGAAYEVSIPGIENPLGGKGFLIKYNSVGRDYFRMVGANILRGRAFDSSDELPKQRTVIVSETMAKRFWPDSDPIGRIIEVMGNSYQIVGVTQDGRINGLHEAPESYVYFFFSQAPRSECSIIVETAGNPTDLAAAVKSKIQSVDKSTVFLFTETSEDVMDQALYEERIAALASGALGILGIVLTAVGLYGILAYLARRRTYEIGIRIALGAQFRDITRLIIVKGLKISAVGIAIGLLISFFSMHLIAGAIYGVAPTDIWIFASGAIFILAISLTASYIPARRAAKTDPIAALRYE
jgi:putative ABC transport system permease protein